MRKTNHSYSDLFRLFRPWYFSPATIFATKTRTTDDSYSDSLHISLTYIAYIASLLNDQSPSATAPPHRDEVAPHWPTVAAITQPFSGTRSLTVEINWKRRQLKSRPLPPVLKKVGGTVEGWTICHTTSTEDVFWRVINSCFSGSCSHWILSAPLEIFQKW